MGKRKRRRASSPLTWKAAKGIFRLVFQGIVKTSPLLLFAAIGLGIFWGIRENLYADPGFQIQSLVVEPPKALPLEKVEQLEKLYLRQNLFKVSPREVAGALERDPRIRAARVVRKFPNTLRIEILNRRPFAQIQLDWEGAYYVVAEDGVVLGKETSRNKNLVLVEAFDVKKGESDKGTRIFLRGYPESIALAKAFAKHSMARTERIDRIRLDYLGNVTLALGKGPELRFGRNPAKKFRMLDSVVPLLAGPDRKQIVYIELQYQDLVVRKK